ncbi:MAG TPA: hypothetical protein ENI39_00985 [Anaerolineae bacterium]|nr:hypothetical protein [Anaerolineae bacterium]
MSSTVSTLQDFPWEESIQAVKDSLRFGSYPAFAEHVFNTLPQNSPQTRRRYTNLIGHWFFPDHQLPSLPGRVWAAYADEKILRDVMRACVLYREPVVAAFIERFVLPAPPGTELQADTFRRYIEETYGEFKRQSRERLTRTLRELGFIARIGQTWYTRAIPPPATAFLILLHDRLAPTPRIVPLSQMLDNPLWWQVGFHTPDEVRETLRDAAATGLIARFVSVDQLEQITTRYTLDEWLARRLRL